MTLLVGNTTVLSYSWLWGTKSWEGDSVALHLGWKLTPGLAGGANQVDSERVDRERQP